MVSVSARRWCLSTWLRCLMPKAVVICQEGLSKLLVLQRLVTAPCTRSVGPIYRGADKSLARLGRKHVTATKP